MVRVAEAAARALGECLSLVFSKDGVVSAARGDGDGEEWITGDAGFCAGLDTVFVCARAGIGFAAGEDCSSIVAVCCTGAR